MKIKICLFILSLPAWYCLTIEPKNMPVKNHPIIPVLQGIVCGSIITFGLASGEEALQEFLVRRRKNRTPNSPNELIKRWEEERQLVDYVD